MLALTEDEDALMEVAGGRAQAAFSVALAVYPLPSWQPLYLCCGGHTGPAMSLALIEGRAAIYCAKCANRITVGETLVLKWGDLESVSFVCEPCAGALKVKWEDQCIDTMPAIQYFQMLAASPRTAAPSHERSSLSSPPARYQLPSPPTITDQDVRPGGRLPGQRRSH